jgi:hypothetical protein
MFRTLNACTAEVKRHPRPARNHAFPRPAGAAPCSRLGEPTVYLELVVVVDSNGQVGKDRLRQQAAAVREALQWFAGHPPPRDNE